MLDNGIELAETTVLSGSDAEAVRSFLATQGPAATPSPKASHLTPKERANLDYQRELSRLSPGTAGFRALKKSHRSMRVYNQPAVYWPTGRALTEGGNGKRRG